MPTQYIRSKTRFVVDLKMLSYSYHTKPIIRRTYNSKGLSSYDMKDLEKRGCVVQKCQNLMKLMVYNLELSLPHAMARQSAMTGLHGGALILQF